MQTDFFHSSVLAMVGLLVSALCWGIKKSADYLSQRTKTMALANFYGRLDALAEKVVKDVYQTTVSAFQASDNWNASTQATAKAQAIAKLKSYIGVEGLHMLEFLAGSGGAASLDEFLGTFVESKVVDSKAVVPAPSALASVQSAATTAASALASKLGAAAPTAPAAATVNPT